MGEGNPYDVRDYSRNRVRCLFMQVCQTVAPTIMLSERGVTPPSATRPEGRSST
jgi:hypothetical protein